MSDVVASPQAKRGQQMSFRTDCDYRMEKGDKEYNGVWIRMSRDNLYDYIIEEPPDIYNYAEMLKVHPRHNPTPAEWFLLTLAQGLSRVTYETIRLARWLNH
jgi:hypothetical protein